MAVNSKHVEELIQDLSGDSRRIRQSAALELCECCVENADVIVAHGDALLDALELNEVRTRWAIIDVFTKICASDIALCEKALPGIENALFDETSGPLHLASVGFLCAYGALSHESSDKAWPMLDEAIQCFHGDQEFPDMLNLLVEFSTKDLSAETKSAFSERMSFDAQNNKGYIKRKAQLIVDNLSK